MITKKEKIEAIYKKIARKDLSFWCKFWTKKEISWWHITFEEWFEFSLITSRKDEKIVFAWENFTWPLYFTNFEFENLEIIWHPVMIWDVLGYLENIALDKIYNYIWVKKEEIPDLVFEKIKDSMKKIFSLWNEKKNAIEDQSDECVDFVYNLIFN